MFCSLPRMIYYSTQNYYESDEGERNEENSIITRIVIYFIINVFINIRVHSNSTCKTLKVKGIFMREKRNYISKETLHVHYNYILKT
jgi:hypothetical protein